MKSQAVNPPFIFLSLPFQIRLVPEVELTGRSELIVSTNAQPDWTPVSSEHPPESQLNWPEYIRWIISGAMKS
ncbi:MAG: hypothetical protein V3T83_05295 [Acidobacteriota bacterium]